jgi:hypothetical protein
MIGVAFFCFINVSLVVKKITNYELRITIWLCVRFVMLSLCLYILLILLIMNYELRFWLCIIPFVVSFFIFRLRIKNCRLGSAP